MNKNCKTLLKNIKTMNLVSGEDASVVWVKVTIENIILLRGNLNEI